MKSIFYILLFGVVSCAKPMLVKNNDLEKENLKGKEFKKISVRHLI